MIFAPDDDVNILYSVTALLNSGMFRYLAGLSLGAGDAAAKSYEVGLIQNTPIPLLSSKSTSPLSAIGSSAHSLKRSLDTGNETSHAFRLPWLLQFGGDTLAGRGAAVAGFRAEVERQLASLQHEIDELAFDLYELSEADRDLVRQEMGVAAPGKADPEAELADPDAGDDPEADDGAEEEEDEEELEAEDLDTYVHRLLSWCVGVAFGRWDVRFALEAELLPELQGAFERLPVVAPAGLVGPDGYPTTPQSIASAAWLRARPNVITLPEGLDEAESVIASAEYPLEVAWDGILVSDSGAALDLAERVRRVLALLFEDPVAVEEEAVNILKGSGRKPNSLDEYFADPKQFFETHLRQYSKSRRKAPLYWPLQTKGGFTVWLYYPRIGSDTLPTVLGEVVIPRLNHQRTEVRRLEEARNQLAGGAEFVQLGKTLDAATSLRQELENMETELNRLISKGYRVDFNDGVILSAAPLHGLIAWKDAGKEFKKLQKGDYPWASGHATWSEG